MRIILRLFLVAMATLVLSYASAQQTAKVTSSGIGYLEYLPQGYNSNNNKYPVVISLHGIKEKGTTSTDHAKIKADLPKVANVGLAKLVKNGTQYPFILISPQLKSSYGMWTADYVMQVVNYVKNNLRVDPSRIYLTGLSLGGFGVWKTVGAYPGVFAAVAPICSGGNAINQACGIAKENVPAWTFHGDKDGTVSYQVSLKMINAINACTPKPSPLAKITIYPGLGHVIWDKVYKETNVLDWMLSHKKGSPSKDTSSPPEKTNALPVVSAGSDRTITLPTNSVTIQGEASDADGKIASYQWSKVSGGSASLSGTTSTKLTAKNLVAGSYTFRLTVKDNSGASKSDDVKVTVKSSSSNTAPVVSAGGDKTLTLPTNSIYITGTASDSDGIASYNWTKVSGGTASLSGTTTAKMRAYNLVAGTYTFRLTVKDKKGMSKSDDVKVIVKNSSSGNVAPVANAGSDKTVTGTSVKLTGSGTDKDGKVTYYKWAKLSGPSCFMYGVSKPTLELSKLNVGTYYFKLTVTDNKGATGTDEVKVVVTRLAASNQNSVSVSAAEDTNFTR